ncbi:BolA/IbaG family iron-sulfur metabolism protein [Buchnera aphidicola]|uniref:BolA/IbaG family iron-sulfur metabolism protein n=1 Tax=Buchnera aphidicola TaxID=9 RepID=UPI002093D988|nr:BolA/IbaG family iron-sulfur metabolism protein [Buchnera aphidicola]USS94459.1 BolA/IbaG family iron-sulfur metabolism protein [Buchnera aphidicola (Periphyllus lyropictus)]
MKKKIKKILFNKLNLSYIKIKKKNNYYKIIAVGKIFSNMNMLEKQKIIYSHLLKYITNKKIHAISIKSYSNKEWNKINKVKLIK